MDRQRTQGSLDRATGTMKEKPDEAPGDHHDRRGREARQVAADRHVDEEDAEQDVPPARAQAGVGEHTAVEEGEGE